jgi:hypothetical protein
MNRKGPSDADSTSSSNTQSDLLAKYYYADQIKDEQGEAPSFGGLT